MRKIIHIDMDAFFASVEQRDKPELRGKPVVVGGLPERRGVVAAASYEARTFGVRSAMPASKAVRLCPHAHFVRPRFEVYRTVSRQIRALFQEYTPLVEPLSLDEAYLDVTENTHANPSATWVAQELRRRIWQQTALTASAGVAPNKFLAKIASDIKKPNGIFVIPPSEAEAFVAQLAIGRFHGIGQATEKRMHQLGIFNGADLRQCPLVDLIKHFGKSGRFFFDISRGIDNRKVVPNRERKSVGVEETYSEDLDQRTQLEAELAKLAKTLEERLGQAKVSGKTVTLKLRYADFETLTRSQSQAAPLAQADPILAIANELLVQSWQKGRGVRLLGITISNLNQPNQGPHPQLPLPFGESLF